jgi:ribosomal protein S18 acetylase RimI-like enzyme
MPPVITIRPATLDDVPAAVRMGLAFRAAYAPHLRENPEQMARIATYLLDAPHALLVAVRPGGAVCGMLGLLIFDHPLSGDRTAGELFWWADPDARNAGAGLLLLDAAEQHARAHGAVTMQMIALATNPTVTELYARRGYVARDQVFERTF